MFGKAYNIYVQVSVAHYLPKPSTSRRWGWGVLRPKSQWYFTIERRRDGMMKTTHKNRVL